MGRGEEFIPGLDTVNDLWVTDKLRIGPEQTEMFPGARLPTGGTTDQVLAKASNADFDTAWVPGGGGGTPTGVHVQTTSIPNYDQDTIGFDIVSYDPDGLWDAGTKRITIPESRLYLVSAYISLVASGAITAGPEFEVTITSIPWNFDPLYFIPQARYSPPTQFVGSISMPLLLNAGCHLAMDGYWNGDPVELSLSSLSVFSL